ncbi:MULTISPECIES: helix-turn-helix domain-containing protein [Amycolatopsis]|uniref:Helix-turn-helix protein n=1 Tax=Amycolatopsis echigonensis TaxID=2576905 RepID=A0A2N3WLI5_9PSEU|nr:MULTISPECIES: helix-turn-helix transcriptional regulator [Amycolatopsis]MBB2500779.1 helix-turn-helix transcriptional regulator [Amycolatopsis echigonensis]MCG3751264.1 helix-turn-helix transcriptional regulator [Amycolatopsis sp. Poz14]PKV94729.1 helix-turn-helix protein [Amycolatopsis niigatensis]
MPTTALSELLNRRLELAGLSQKELAEKVAVTPGRISQIMGGERPGESLLEKICEVLHIPEEMLLNAEIRQIVPGVALDPFEQMVLGLNDLSDEQQDGLLAVYASYTGRSSLRNAATYRKVRDSSGGDDG